MANRGNDRLGHAEEPHNGVGAERQGPVEDILLRAHRPLSMSA